MKTLVQLEQVMEGKAAHFLVEHDTPISIVKLMLQAFLEAVIQHEIKVKAQAEAAQVPEPAETEEIKEEQ